MKKKNNALTELKSKNKTLAESMTKICIGGHIIRVWREEPKVELEKMWDSQREIDSLVRKMYLNTLCDYCEFSKLILAFDRVNAVEMTEVHSGDGVVLYKNWP